MHIQHDTQNQPYIEWQAGSPDVIRRVWITHQGTGRYLKLAPMDPSKRAALASMPVAFPIFSKLADEEVLEEFAGALGAVTGCRIP